MERRVVEYSKIFPTIRTFTPIHIDTTTNNTLLTHKKEPKDDMIQLNLPLWAYPLRLCELKHMTYFQTSSRTQTLETLRTEMDILTGKYKSKFITVFGETTAELYINLLKEYPIKPVETYTDNRVAPCIYYRDLKKDVRNGVFTVCVSKNKSPIRRMFDTLTEAIFGYTALSK